MALESKERGRMGLGGKKVAEKRFRYLGWIGGPRKVREPLW